LSDEVTKSTLIEMTADIVSAFVAKNPVAVADVPGVIAMIHGALSGVGSSLAPTQPIEQQRPAVSVRKSVSPDFLICLEDGQPFKSLKRHLRTKYDMSPEDYRAKWALPKDYPMVAPNYSGLGPTQPEGSDRQARSQTAALEGKRRALTAQPRSRIRRGAAG
jgi:predicted transcriptional regulator